MITDLRLTIYLARGLPVVFRSTTNLARGLPVKKFGQPKIRLTLEIQKKLNQNRNPCIKVIETNLN